MRKDNENFLANSFYSYVCRIFMYLPIISGLILLFDNFQFGIIFLIGGIVASCLFYFCCFYWYFGFLKFTKEFIYTPNDFVPKNARLQYKEKIYYKDICAIEFKDRDGNSIGKPLWKAYSVSYLEITTNDNCIHRIAIDKYSRKTWIKIEKLIINNRDILVLRDAKSFIKSIKIRIL